MEEYIMAEITKKNDNATKTTKRVTVRIPKLQGQNAIQEEWFAVNGRPCQVRRGETVEIREEIAEVIRNNEKASDYAMDYIDNLNKDKSEKNKALNM
jgi:hypothetical protein